MSRDGDHPEAPCVVSVNRREADARKGVGEDEDDSEEGWGDDDETVAAVSVHQRIEELRLMLEHAMVKTSALSTQIEAQIVLPLPPTYLCSNL